MIRPESRLHSESRKGKKGGGHFGIKYTMNTCLTSYITADDVVLLEFENSIVMVLKIQLVKLDNDGDNNPVQEVCPEC